MSHAAVSPEPAAPDSSAARAHEERTVGRVTIITVALFGGFFAIRSILADTVMWAAETRTAAGFPLVSSEDLIPRAGIDVAATITMVLLAWVLKPARRRAPAVLLCIVVTGLVTAWVKVGLKYLAGYHQLTTAVGVSAALVEALTVFVVGALILTGGLVFASLWRRTLSAERSRLEAQERMAMLLRSSQVAEFRLRERLSVSIRAALERLFVTLEAQLTHLSRTIGEDQDVKKQRARLQGISQELARVRSGELVSLSSLVFPVDLGRGIAAGIRATVGLLPPHIARDLDIDEAGGRIDHDAVGSVHLVVLARIVEIGVARAQRHAGVRNVRVELSYDDTSRRVRVLVEDDGRPDPGDATADSIAYARLQAEVYNGAVELGALGDGRGSRLIGTFELPTTEG